jgi:hypothetical protein
LIFGNNDFAVRKDLHWYAIEFAADTEAFHTLAGVGIVSGLVIGAADNCPICRQQIIAPVVKRQILVGASVDERPDFTVPAAKKYGKAVNIDSQRTWFTNVGQRTYWGPFGRRAAIGFPRVTHFPTYPIRIDWQP